MHYEIRFLLAVFIISLVGCGNSSTSVATQQTITPTVTVVSAQPSTPPNVPVGTAFLRLANVSTISGPLTLLIDGNVEVASLAPESLSDYIQIPSGTTRLTLRDANNNTYVIELNPTFTDGSFNTFSVFDSPEGPTALGFQAVEDSNLTRIPNRAKFRFFNATRAVGPVKVVAIRDDMSTFEVVGLTAPGFAFTSNELDVIDFDGVRRIELQDVNDVPVAVFTDARQITAEQLMAFGSWNPMQGVCATFYLTGTVNMATVNLSILGAVDDPDAGGLTIIGDGATP